MHAANANANDLLHVEYASVLFSCRSPGLVRRSFEGNFTARDLLLTQPPAGRVEVFQTRSLY